MSTQILLCRPHLPGDEDLTVPSNEAIIPNPMLNHSDILEIVLNIRNPSLRKAVLQKEDIDFDIAAKILFTEPDNETEFQVGEKVALKIEVAAQLPERLFQVELVILISLFQINNN